MATKQNLEAQNPLILRCNRLIEAFAKSDDERDFYLDRLEGFIFYIDLDKPEEELQSLEKEIEKNKNRYCMIPKLTFYETKKIMEGFINEKVYDIDTKEKLLDIIQSKEARENFLEFIYDHHSELEKWQIYYQERSRIRIIEWLRVNNFSFVFEEDLEFPKLMLEKLKKELFRPKAGKDILTARKTLIMKAKTYYSNEALNPRPKRGRPPKQTQKVEMEPQITTDIYTTVPNGLRSFLFIPDLTGAATSTFSSKFGNEEDLFWNRRSSSAAADLQAKNLSEKLAALRTLSTKWRDSEEAKIGRQTLDDDDDDDEEEEALDIEDKPKKENKTLAKKKIISKTPPSLHSAKKSTKTAKPTKSGSKKNASSSLKSSPKKSGSGKTAAQKKKQALRPMMKLKKKH